MGLSRGTSRGRKNGRAASWQASHQDPLLPASRRDGQSSAFAEIRAFWRQSSSPGLSIPTGRNCTICAARVRPRAPSRRRRPGRNPPDFHRRPTRRRMPRAILQPRPVLSAAGAFSSRGRLRPRRLRATMAFPPAARFEPVHNRHDGPIHDAASLCNSRRLFQALADFSDCPGSRIGSISPSSKSPSSPKLKRPLP